MKTFKDVYITLNEGTIESFIDEVTGLITPPWQRAYENEDYSSFVGDTAFSFQRQHEAGLPAAGLSIFHKDKNTWFIPNVVPIEEGRLSFDEYNQVLTEFFQKFLVPASSKRSALVTITSGELTAEDIVGEHGAKRLNAFSSMANMSTGSSHPMDKERWLDFIIATYNSGEPVDTSNLERLLQLQGWSATHARDLVIQFEFGSDLLAHMEQYKDVH